MGPAETQLLTVIDKGVAGDIRIHELIPVRFSRLETIT
ncbi:hypothetical protein [Limobrevibacterium gyesilva]